MLDIPVDEIGSPYQDVLVMASAIVGCWLLSLLSTLRLRQHVKDVTRSVVLRHCHCPST